jgi:hypothetical protein
VRQTLGGRSIGGYQGLFVVSRSNTLSCSFALDIHIPLIFVFEIVIVWFFLSLNMGCSDESTGEEAQRTLLWRVLKYSRSQLW